MSEGISIGEAGIVLSATSVASRRMYGFRPGEGAFVNCLVRKDVTDSGDEDDDEDGVDPEV